MNTLLKTSGILILILLSSCRSKTQEDQHSRVPISTVTREIDQEEEISSTDSISVIPIEHASFMMRLKDQVIYVDPVGKVQAYQDLAKPSLVLITDIHGDHFSPELLEEIIDQHTTLLLPRAAYDQMPMAIRNQAKVIGNQQDTLISGIHIEAIPMYNIRDEAQSFHPKGRGNGYVLEADGKRIYISGDTEDIPEMRALKAIDIAFVCMNLPYTMTVDQAADAVLDFKPKRVYPYHYKGTDGFSDVEQFKSTVEAADPNISVQLLAWYPED